jgi:3-mercaptopropionate dioxygenase
VIPPDTTTPVHDHGSWGLVGLYRGRQAETYYNRVDDGSVEGKAVLQFMEEQSLEEGDFYPLLPGARDIHSVGSISPQPTISIHLLANDTGCVDRRQYDFDAQTVKPFRSGWSNLPCDDDMATS